MQFILESNRGSTGRNVGCGAVPQQSPVSSDEPW